MPEASLSALTAKVELVVVLDQQDGSPRIRIGGPKDGNVRGPGGKVEIDWVLQGGTDAHTLKIEFLEFLAADDGTAPAPVSPLEGGQTTLAGAREYKGKKLKKLGKGELVFICKYTVSVEGSTAPPLDPVIIIDK
jgi:hypothetical protein